MVEPPGALLLLIDYRARRDTTSKVELLGALLLLSGRAPAWAGLLNARASLERAIEIFNDNFALICLIALVLSGPW